MPNGGIGFLGCGYPLLINPEHFYGEPLRLRVSPPPRPAESAAAPLRAGAFSHGDPVAWSSRRPPRSAAPRERPESPPPTPANQPVPTPVPALQGRSPAAEPRAPPGAAPLCGDDSAPHARFPGPGIPLRARQAPLETKAKFGPSPSGRARQSVCPRHRRALCGRSQRRSPLLRRPLRAPGIHPAPAAGRERRAAGASHSRYREPWALVKVGRGVWGEQGAERR